MSGIAHSMRKRLSIATTRTKTVEKNISSEYTTQKHAILRGKETLEKAVEIVKKKAHSELGTGYKKFSELISGDAPADTPLFTRTSEALEASNEIHSKSKAPFENDSSAFKLIAHVEAYINELKTVEKEFPTVEKGFVEVSRYERKVSKLNEKTTKQEKSKSSDKAVDRTKRNLNKLESERAAFQAKLDSVIEMMKKSNAKYEKLLDCVHTAFWITEDEFFGSAMESTKSVREQSKQAATELVDLDVASL